MYAVSIFISCTFQTTEQELKSFFSNFGQVKDVKIISDRLGVSKGFAILSIFICVQFQ